ncbi:hypothetical protein Goshw_026390, partial [Gossypium schwendimanii]|nr:hypothetical protein [Gossypium schwendimanii]
DWETHVRGSKDGLLKSELEDFKLITTWTIIHEASASQSTGPPCKLGRHRYAGEPVELRFTPLELRKGHPKLSAGL